MVCNEGAIQSCMFFHAIRALSGTAGTTPSNVSISRASRTGRSGSVSNGIASHRSPRCLHALVEQRLQHQRKVNLVGYALNNGATVAGAFYVTSRSRRVRVGETSHESKPQSCRALTTPLRSWEEIYSNQVSGVRMMSPYHPLRPPLPLAQTMDPPTHPPTHTHPPPASGCRWFVSSRLFKSTRLPTNAMQRLSVPRIFLVLTEGLKVMSTLNARTVG
jgi:hypothetical protein